jgi:hypothetical protein
MLMAFESRGECFGYEFFAHAWEMTSYATEKEFALADLFYKLKIGLG